MEIKHVLDIVDNTKKFKVYFGDLYHYFRFLFNAPSNSNPYHNFMHSCHVLSKSYEMAFYSKLPRADGRKLLIAAMFHDFGHSGKMGNDDREIETALFFLKEIILPEDRGNYAEIASLISATRYPYIEGNFSESALILRDADLSQILADNWFDLCVVGLSKEMDLSLRETLKENIRFLKNLRFQSAGGKSMLQLEVLPRLSEAQKLYNVIA